jgi:hypothetical protein
VSNDVGKVVFADGTTFYPVVQSTVGFVYRRLFADPQTAFAERYVEQSGALPPNIADEEVVAVWEWHLSDDAQPCFYSRASRSHLLLTGPRCRAEVAAANPEDSGW